MARGGASWEEPFITTGKSTSVKGVLINTAFPFSSKYFLLFDETDLQYSPGLKFPFGTFPWNLPIMFPAGLYLPTIYAHCILNFIPSAVTVSSSISYLPIPSTVLFFHTTCVKWPVPPENPPEVKS